MADADVVVVGGGPAGAAVAIALGRRGRRVVVLDRATFPREKACGECLSPGAVAHLHALGVAADVLAAGATPVRGLRLTAPDGTRAEAYYPQGALGYAVPRMRLDPALLAAARRTPGVEVREHAAVSGLRFAGDANDVVPGVPSAGGADAGGAGGAFAGDAAGAPAGRGAVIGVVSGGEPIRARLVVGADGRFSQVRQWAFGKDPATRTDRYCFVMPFEGALMPDDMLACGLRGPGLQYLQVYQGRGRYHVCLVVDGATRDEHRLTTAEGFAALCRRLPGLAERLGDATPAGPLKGMPMNPYAAPRLVADGLLLAGDATGFLDPITGEGMCRALDGAALAAGAIDAALDGDAAALAGYEAAMRARYGPVVRFADLTVGLTTLPPLGANALVRAMGAWPQAAGAYAAVQGALMAPDDLWNPLRWPSFRSLPAAASFKPLGGLT